MFQLDLTEIKISTILGNLLMKFVDAIQSYGVPEFDIYNPPWPGGYDERTDNGVLFTRVERWMYETYGIKLYSVDKSDLSNLLSASIVHPGVSIEVNNDFQWNPGDYGDKKSCFWGGKRQAWPMIYKLGGSAVKLYRNGKGIARCLVLPYGEDNSKPILFNSYGMHLGHIANLYATAMRDGNSEPIPIAWADLSVDGKTNKPVHINDKGGYVIGVSDPKPTDISAAKYYLRRYDKYHLFCEKCYHRVSMESDSGGSVSKDYTHVVLCRECYGEFKNSTTGFPARYLPQNAWYTKHRRVEEAQPDDSAAPAEPDSPFRITSESQGGATWWDSASTGVRISSGDSTTATRQTTSSFTRFATYSFNLPNVALDRKARTIGLESMRNSVNRMAASLGIPPAEFAPTRNELIALYLLGLSATVRNALTESAFRAVSEWRTSIVQNVIATWLGVMWDGNASSLYDVTLSPFAFDVRRMAVQILEKSGFNRENTEGLSDNEVASLVDIVVKTGLAAAVRRYDTITRREDPDLEDYEGDEEDEGQPSLSI